MRYLWSKAGASLRDGLVHSTESFIHIYAGKWTKTLQKNANLQNLAALNVCRGFVGAGAAVLIPAAAGMIGSIYPPGRKRTFAFIAISCGQSLCAIS